MRIFVLFVFFLFLQNTGQWEIASTKGPEARYINKLVQTRDGLLLFGGKNNLNNGFNDLWTWNQDKWTSIGAGATERWDHSYAYMKDRDQLILFGGRSFAFSDGSQQRIELGDSWTYKNNDWQKLRIEGPPARSSHALSGSPGEVILFGGRNKEITFDDTWTFNGTTWRELKIVGPGKRYGHTLSFDSKTNSHYLFGGHNGTQVLNDLWAFKNDQWTEVKITKGPSARMAHAMQFDDRGNAILFGGWDGSVSNELWRWSDDQWIFISSKGGSKGRLSHAIGYTNREFILFGGSTGFGEGFLAETWRLRIDSNQR